MKQAVILSNVGVVCQGEGRWDEAMDYYERGRAESLKIGDTVDAALARMNVAEILSTAASSTEAEALLLETLPFWRASKYRYFLGGCLWLLGRVALRAGRVRTTRCRRFDDAKANFVHVGAEQDVLAVDARIAESQFLLGRTDAALALADATLGARGLGRRRGGDGAAAPARARRCAAAARRLRRAHGRRSRRASPRHGRATTCSKRR